MPTLRPPRREPRVLALAADDHGLRFAVVDPWEVRSTGIEACRPRSRRLATLRLIAREKPSLLVAADDVGELALRVARHRGLAVVPGPLPEVSAAAAADLYPDIAIRAPTRELAEVVRLGIAAILHGRISPRSYATTRRRRTTRRAA